MPYSYIQIDEFSEIIPSGLIATISLYIENLKGVVHLIDLFRN